MADRDDAADAAAQILVRENALKDWFSTDSPNGAVNAEDVQQFLNELAEIQFMPAVAAAGRADAIIDAGHTSIHMMAELTAGDLIGLGFLSGNAKKMAS